MSNLQQIDSLEALDEALYELESAEDFLEFFQLEFQPEVVQVNRLHILQRFHNYLQQQEELPDSVQHRIAVYQTLLDQSYQSFINSSAQQEKVLKIFNRPQPGQGFVSLTAISTQSASKPEAL
ncbi:nitrogenase-stabilizing/protective protein NifW [Oceanospirillum sediminis]|uniref:Nitrogenase-stabilizing/protective protein NifW n=1 Tax=Oceanospirillum sediminis TaxID=2760088 RepID=A0A839IP98_9GAMM|nr:nitrogenase-stabilizing/protective protein NifW [Oceanospirillum sediminis]MBB1486500.1 nitrogenase-stabilizing/protective protein NifW [Oceanospirillum sediminis]